MNVSMKTKKWYEEGGCEKIRRYMDDVDGIFSTDNGSKKGVYGVYVITPLAQEIPMYFGEVGKEERCFLDRLVEHAKQWIESPELYTGLLPSELENGYKYLIRILAEENDEEKRYGLEQALIEEFKPYLQFSCYPKFKVEYRGNDLTIFRTYRRRAFIVARDGKYTESNELLVDRIFSLDETTDFSLSYYRDKHLCFELMRQIEKEMPKGSDKWRSVKEFV